MHSFTGPYCLVLQFLPILNLCLVAYRLFCLMYCHIPLSTLFTLYLGSINTDVDKNLNAVSLYLLQGPVFTAVIQEWAPWLYQVSNTDLNLIIFYIMRVCLQTISLLKTPASPTAIFSYIVGPIPFQ